jgi:hypothetical protein
MVRTAKKKATDITGKPGGSTFAERLTALKGDETYHALARKMNEAGLSVTAQGLHKWCNGGGISADNLKDVARYFGVSPAFLYFGETAETSSVVDDLTPDARLIARAWLRMPERFRTPLAVEILKVALAFADKQDVSFQLSVKQALEKLTKGES